MRYTLFISDLHLDAKHKQSTQIFKNFMLEHAPLAEAIYILGDFFEMWIGDYSQPFFQEIKKELRLLSKHVPIYFLHGNRDFLIGKRFEWTTGCKILPENSVIDLYGKKVLLLHGDALCALDIKHMKFRKLSQNLFLRSVFLSLPLSIRRYIGTRLRSNSKKHHDYTAAEYLDVVPAMVAELLHEYQVTHMIHGHIHKPAVFNFNMDNLTAERIVLGAWEKQGCYLKWHENGKREMIFFK